MLEIDRIFKEATEGEGCCLCDQMRGDRWSPWSSVGRLGPSTVVFDVSTNVGSLSMDGERLHLTSLTGFSSIKACVGVYRGKWQYEVMIGTKGVMQVGWATHKCRFSQEKGVGDSPDSYAYDGNRVRKWNVQTFEYGEAWFPGDVIGCTIDLDSGVVDFYRNGNHLGVAFDGVRMGPGFCYFPAVSLAYNETLTANFGGRPLRYPVPGFQPLQETPLLEVAKADVLINWLFNLIEESFPSSSPSLTPVERLTVMLVSNLLLEKLSPLLVQSKFVVESSLLRKLISLSDDHIMQHFLDLLWCLLDKSAVHGILESLTSCLITCYRFCRVVLNRKKDDSTSGRGDSNSPVYSSSPFILSSTGQSHSSSASSSKIAAQSSSQSTSIVEQPKLSFSGQKAYLTAFLRLCQHSKTRLYLLRNILFDKAKFPYLMDIKPVNEAAWLEKEVFPFDEQLDVSDLDKKLLRSPDIEVAVGELEELQRTILDTLIFQDEVCRLVFIQKFDTFLRENTNPITMRMSTSQMIPYPLPVLASFFHRLTSLIRVQYESVVRSLPTAFFLDSSNGGSKSLGSVGLGLEMRDQTRLGGVVSHLTRVHEEEIKTVNPDSMNPLLKHVYILIHGLIRLYSFSSHKFLLKHCAVRERLIEVSTTLESLKGMRTSSESRLAERSEPIKLTESVLKEELLSKSRQLGWLNSTALTPSKRADVSWLLAVVLNTLTDSSSSEMAFSFIPDIYVEACLNMCLALRSLFGFSPSGQERGKFCPYLSIVERLSYTDILNQFCTFVCSHFSDSRVINSDIRDSLAQALAAFMSQEDTLRCVEGVPSSIRDKMLSSLLQSYDNRSWTHTNWILLRIWKGSGLAYRYSIPPNLKCRISGSALSNKDILASLNFQSPCPSVVFQQHLKSYLLSHPEVAHPFLSSLISQLNWSFSEFIGMLQEIQNAANKPEKVFIDSRQLKMCFSCFDLTVALLRVLEMISVLAPTLLTSSIDPSADLLLGQLCSLLNQVLSRVTTRTGCFEFVTSLDIPGLEAVSHFPIIAAVCGILVALVLKAPSDSRKATISAIISDANFLPSNFSFINSRRNSLSTPTGSGGVTITPTTVSSSPWSSFLSQQQQHHILNQYPSPFLELTEVSSEEMEELREMTSVIVGQLGDSSLAGSSADEISDDEVCTICYANRKTASFIPCGHQSCR